MLTAKIRELRALRLKREAVVHRSIDRVLRILRIQENRRGIGSTRAFIRLDRGARDVLVRLRNLLLATFDGLPDFTLLGLRGLEPLRLASVFSFRRLERGARRVEACLCIGNPRLSFGEGEVRVGKLRVNLVEVLAQRCKLFVDALLLFLLVVDIVSEHIVVRKNA